MSSNKILNKRLATLLKRRDTLNKNIAEIESQIRKENDIEAVSRGELGMYEVIFDVIAESFNGTSTLPKGVT